MNSKYTKKAKKGFTNLHFKIEELKEEESEQSESYGESHVYSAFLLRDNCLGLEPSG